MNKYFLTEEELTIQEMARKFADEVVAPTVTELDRKRRSELPVSLPHYGAAGSPLLFSGVHHRRPFRPGHPDSAEGRHRRAEAEVPGPRRYR